ncbi:DUF2207 domain-containing protein [Patescibacteria group bacterium]|nr:DUF2207 domain-containing protein [Patescibacteria group bacterium]MCL5114366.1 DUF2207 domain-containing protein [Patescibacteria group bacterium]
MLLKKYAWGFTVFAAFAVATFGFGHVARASAEAVQSFNSQIAVAQNGTLSVAETIVYDFGSDQRHGIFRDIPLSSPNGPGLQVTVTGVGNGAGGTYPYTASVSDNTLDIRIGDPNVLVSGVKTYVVDYIVKNAVREFSDHDEVYWNVTGNSWGVPLNNVTASIVLPGQIAGLTATCYTGAAGSTAKDCSSAESGSGMTYATTRPLGSGEGLSVVLGIPFGHLALPAAAAAPTASAPAGFSSSGGIPSVIPLMFILFLILAVTAFRIIVLRSRGGFSGISLRTRSRPIIPRELKKIPLVAEYDPPDGLLPIEVGTIVDRKVDMADVSSVIMDLAIKGYLKIRYTVRQMKLWPDKKDFELVKLKDGSDLRHPAYQIVFNMLFTARDSVSLSDLQSSGAALFETLKSVGKKTDENIYAEGYFDTASREKTKKERVLFGLSALGLLILFIIGMALGGGSSFVIIMVMFAVALLIGEIGKPPIPKLTPKGMTALQKILGFREFLRYTETDRLKMMNAPSLRPEQFEKYLPYAMVLGVEKEWAKKFEGITTAMPTWYEDPTITAFNSSLFMANIMLFNSSFNRTFNVASQPASSGFGAGGFSGGGFGGGGGGSW